MYDTLLAQETCIDGFMHFIKTRAGGRLKTLRIQPRNLGTVSQTPNYTPLSWVRMWPLQDQLTLATLTPSWLGATESLAPAPLRPI